MTLPVIYSAAYHNHEIKFTVLTQPFLCSLFINAPDNLTAIPLDTKGKQKSLLGLLKYALSIPGAEYDIVIDLHNVIRSRVISSVLSLKGCRCFMLKKDRKGRKAIINHLPDSKPLKPVIQQYADTLREAGLKFDVDFRSLFENGIKSPQFHNLNKEKQHIGIAPFAKHAGKIYPTEKMEEVIKLLSETGKYEIYLFGSKGKEGELLSQWENKYPGVNSVVGKYKLPEELELISSLDVMVSMDSANMHFAAIAGTKVISIWGATHTDTGFLGYNCSPENIIQLDMPCRPCSVFGQKPCSRGDIACLRDIKPEMIVQKILTVIGDNN